MIDWLKFDVADEWHRMEEKIILADILLAGWIVMVKNHVFRTKDRYGDLYSEFFHDGNRTAGHLESVVKLIRDGDKQVTNSNLWYPLYQLYKYLRYVQALNELTGRQQHITIGED